MVLMLSTPLALLLVYCAGTVCAHERSQLEPVQQSHPGPRSYPRPSTRRCSCLLSLCVRLLLLRANFRGGSCRSFHFCACHYLDSASSSVSRATDSRPRLGPLRHLQAKNPAAIGSSRVSSAACVRIGRSEEKNVAGCSDFRAGYTTHHRCLPSVTFPFGGRRVSVRVWLVIVRRRDEAV